MAESRYLFAYGSLIGKSSADSEEIKIPINVAGLKRGWYVSVPEDRSVGLGVIHQEGARCNGVLVAASDDYLSRTDARETQHGYSRVSLPWEAVTIVEPPLPKTADLWVYVVDATDAPTQACPIAQSYLDVVLGGCLEISEDFAADFIRTTHGWEHVWIDDRARPRYRRAISADVERIDALLEKVIPAHLSRRIR